ncbi:MAG: hypothetical protein MUC69_03235 [Gemmatimonadales bacterium]|nr:hypothetical protein [Gemmatimonadales bacterium]
MRHPAGHLLRATTLGLAVGLAACADGPTSDTSSDDRLGSVLTSDAPSSIEVCKITVDGPSLTRLETLTTATVSFSGALGTGSIASALLESLLPDGSTLPPRNGCVTRQIPVDATSLVVTETPGAGSRLYAYTIRVPGEQPNFTVVEPAVNGAVALPAIAVQPGGLYYSVLLKNVVTDTPPPSGGQGCTPGYWRQAHHYDSWVGYRPDQLFSSVFEDAFPGKILGQVVALGGGGINALGRHTVAALLNAASGGVNYAFTVQQVIDGFNAANPTGDVEGQKNSFETQNEKGCPLN